MQLREDSEVDELERRQQESAHEKELEMQHAVSQQQEVAPREDQGAATFVRNAPKVGRNDPCPCGSTKKYKQCHGKIS